MTAAASDKSGKRRIGLLAAGMMLTVLLAGCGISLAERHRLDDCLDREIRRIRESPEQTYLTTLDGQHIPLADIFAQCRRRFPPCVLPEKFYHWQHETLEVASRSSGGLVKHRIRAYYNLMSVCKPDRVDPGRTHGDVAEFYDEHGVYMGLAVYMGDGWYIPLPHPGYTGRATLRAFHTGP